MNNRQIGPVMVDAAAVSAVFDWRSAITALQEAYAQDEGGAASPPRTIAASGDAWLRIMAAVPPGRRYFGAKLMGAAMGCATRAVEYVVVLFDRETSSLAGFVDANLLTGYRTAATTAAAVDRMAPAGPARLAVIGSGLEATMHTRAIASIRELAEVSVYSPTPEKRAAFAQAIRDELGIPARAAESGEDAVRGADLVLSAARSRGEVPILYADWIKPGATVMSIGSTIPSQREIDVSVAALADLVVCDNVHEVLEETGDMLAARAEGIAVADKCFSIGQLMRSELAARQAGANIQLYKSVGGGLQDVVIADVILSRALDAGLVQPLPASFERKTI